ncbi:hypothetical protein DRP05_15145 [Archaeoglobales archaeon]|nr:MAG: hypothetical protein DRP05_15145 [Archaeoglobales archaeon]
MDELGTFEITKGERKAVMETGFSTYEPIWHNEEKQQFINSTFPAIREKVLMNQRSLPLSLDA